MDAKDANGKMDGTQISQITQIYNPCEGEEKPSQGGLEEVDVSGEFGFCSECGKAVEVVVEPQDRLQARVAKAVQERGYREGWTARQFLGRQTAKLLEELAEFSSPLIGIVPEYLFGEIVVAGDTGKFQFDHGEWEDGYLSQDTLRNMRMELFDMQVVLVNMAAAIESLLNEECDLLKGAVEKAEVDVERGVRR